VSEQIRQLAWDISSCAEVHKAEKDNAHPCHGVVDWQVREWQAIDNSLSLEDISRQKLQRPEAWTGDLANAKILFLASNPSFDAQEKFPTWDSTSEAWEGHVWNKENVIDFASHRFVHKGVREFGAIDGPSPDDSDRTLLIDGTVSKKVNHWRWVRNLTAFILDQSPEDTSAHSDFVMTEIVHCKSTYEAGVPKAIPKCSQMWLERMWTHAGARIIVIAGAKAGEEFARLYGNQLPDTWGSWTTKPSCPTKGKGTWPTSGAELEAWVAEGKWGESQHRVHTTTLELGGKTRTIIYFARPGGTSPTAPWKNTSLVDASLLKLWRNALEES
jgi:hypothetical protein